MGKASRLQLLVYPFPIKSVVFDAASVAEARARFPGLRVVALERGRMTSTETDFQLPQVRDELRYVHRQELMQDHRSQQPGREKNENENVAFLYRRQRIHHLRII